MTIKTTQMAILIAVILLVFANEHSGSSFIDRAEDDEYVYTIISRSGLDPYGDMLVIHRHDGGQMPIYESDFLNLKPWKIEIGDLDGDGVTDMLVAVYKLTHFDDEERNRLFVFNYNGEIMYKKWTGSQIAGEWRQFIVGDLLSIPGDEIIFIEQIPELGERLQLYYWFDFGFVFLAASEIYDHIVDVEIIAENQIQMKTRSGQRERSTILTVVNGKIIERDS